MGDVVDERGAGWIRDRIPTAACPGVVTCAVLPLAPPQSYNRTYPPSRPPLTPPIRRTCAVTSAWIRIRVRRYGGRSAYIVEVE